MNTDLHMSPVSADQNQPISPTRHSGLGVASFVLSICVALLGIVVFIVAVMMEATTPGGMSEESPGAIAVGLAIFALAGIGILGLVLGIASLFQNEKKRMFGILGITISILTLAGGAGLMLLGLLVD